MKNKKKQFIFFLLFLMVLHIKGAPPAQMYDFSKTNTNAQSLRQSVDQFTKHNVNILDKIRNLDLKIKQKKEQLTHAFTTNPFNKTTIQRLLQDIQKYKQQKIILQTVTKQQQENNFYQLID